MLSSLYIPIVCISKSGFKIIQQYLVIGWMVSLYGVSSTLTLVSITVMLYSTTSHKVTTISDCGDGETGSYFMRKCIFWFCPSDVLQRLCFNSVWFTEFPVTILWLPPYCSYKLALLADSALIDFHWRLLTEQLWIAAMKVFRCRPG